LYICCTYVTANKWKHESWMQMFDVQWSVNSLNKKLHSVSALYLIEFQFFYYQLNSVIICCSELPKSILDFEECISLFTEPSCACLASDFLLACSFLVHFPQEVGINLLPFCSYNVSISISPSGRGGRRSGLWAHYRNLSTIQADICRSILCLAAPLKAGYVMYDPCQDVCKPFC